MIKAVLVNLEQDITDTLTEVRYEIVDIDSPAWFNFVLYLNRITEYE